MPALNPMLKDILSDEKTYQQVIRRKSKSLAMLLLSHILVRDPLGHLFKGEEAVALRSRIHQPFPRKAPLPKWLAVKKKTRPEKPTDPIRLTISPAAENAINRLCRLMRKDSYEFSRMRVTALLKYQEPDKEGMRPRKNTLPQSEYRSLTPRERSRYRIMLKPTFPDTLVVGALTALFGKLFPTKYFFRESCAYIANRGTKETVRRVISGLNKGYRVVLRLDVKSFNETVPQERLVALILDRAQKAGWSDEDCDFLKRLMGRYFSRVDEVLMTPGTGIGMGTGLTPLFTNIYLHQLDTYIKVKRIPFCRFGDDVVLFLNDPAYAEEVREDMKRFVLTELGQRVNEGKATIAGLYPVAENEAGPEHGFDFCAYHYRINEDNQPIICIRDATIEKIRRRVRFLTRIEAVQDGPRKCHARHMAPAGVHTDPCIMPLAEKIWRISTLLGFPPDRMTADNKVLTHATGIGWPASFLNDAASDGIKEQFRDLDRYILYRLARIERAVGGDRGTQGNLHRRMRDLGLMSFMDAWNHHPRPYRY